MSHTNQKHWFSMAGEIQSWTSHICSAFWAWNTFSFGGGKQRLHYSLPAVVLTNLYIFFPAFQGWKELALKYKSKSWAHSLRKGRCYNKQSCMKWRIARGSEVCLSCYKTFFTPVTPTWTLYSSIFPHCFNASYLSLSLSPSDLCSICHCPCVVFTAMISHFDLFSTLQTFALEQNNEVTARWW